MDRLDLSTRRLPSFVIALDAQLVELQHGVLDHRQVPSAAGDERARQRKIHRRRRVGLLDRGEHFFRAAASGGRRRAAAALRKPRPHLRRKLVVPPLGVGRWQNGSQSPDVHFCTVHKTSKDRVLPCTGGTITPAPSWIGIHSLVRCHLCVRRAQEARLQSLAMQLAESD
jgi:hypothetical protein